MRGVYKITNLVNGHAYIGISDNIHNRWICHISESKSSEYPLYRAIRKYGIENFELTVLEKCPDISREELEEREKFWIAHFNTFKNGYNQTPGGDVFTQDRHGELHPNHKLTEAEVIDIRVRWAAKKESVVEIWEDYKGRIEKTGFKKIYSWQTWKNVLPELFTEENRAWHANNGVAFSNSGSKNPKAKLVEEDVIDIRTRKKAGESAVSVYEDYKDVVTFGSFRNIWYGCNWKHVVV